MKTNPLQKSARVCGVNASVEIHLLFKPKLEKKKKQTLRNTRLNCYQSLDG